MPCLTHKNNTHALRRTARCLKKAAAVSCRNNIFLNLVVQVRSVQVRLFDFQASNGTLASNIPVQHSAVECWTVTAVSCRPKHSYMARLDPGGGFAPANPRACEPWAGESSTSSRAHSRILGSADLRQTRMFWMVSILAVDEIDVISPCTMVHLRRPP